ncbi:eukaryotic membrane protein family-domain-containing protein [Rhodotorula diobovata]|uniref:Eukaryotic membrane protein family-domain-containing protein n=1 Tax=Rhodotorula diobovata TaxID=5288 RepID=A0A5C5G4P2_9BASI|nr:eukaryotic membrane protein family-domain-containing protein [Rhodotorula diobovata]
MPPPTSRSLPNLALEADPPSDLDPDDDASSLLLDLVDAPSAPPELELAPPVTFTAPSTPRASPRLGKRARSDDEDVEPGWGAPPDEALARDEPGRPGPDPHIRERSASLGGGSIHSAPELELEQRPDSPSLASPAGGIERGLRAESPAPLSDGDEAGSGNGNGNGTGRDAEREGRRRRRRAGERLATLWDYLQEELFTVEMDGEEGVKSERVTNFLAVPQELEKIIVFGVFICLDSFLYTFTILPLRAFAAACQLVSNEAHNLVRLVRSGPVPRKRHLRLSHKCDLTKAAILAGTLALLHKVTDASRMYHGVRGQETIKLYVLFNVLEIADRLCCSFGQDLQDSLFSRQTLGRRTDGSHPHVRPVALFGLTLGYVVAHSVVLFYQLITLNVAVNSYSNALLTLLLSNQFVEIKGSVFKKFEKENLFQLTCADIVERFQLGLMLFIISLRNLIARSSLPSLSLSLTSYLPSSTSLSLPALLSLLHQSFSPAVVVLSSECAVDWLKHAFITKFNHIRPGVYGRFVDVLCKDLVTGAAGRGGRRSHEGEPFVDQSPLVSRRLGFAALPLGCLVVRVISQAFEMLADESGVDECAVPPSSAQWGGSGPKGVGRGEEVDAWARVGRGVVVALVVGVGWMCLVALKLLIGISLRSFASHRLLTSSSRLAEEALASRSRPKIGVSPAEEALDREVAALLKGPLEGDTGGGGERRKGLEELGRYDMVKSRLW